MGKVKLVEIIKLVVSIGVCQLAGLIGAFFTTPAIPNWYAALNKPSFNPPSSVFGPVWFILYTMMGIAAYLVWRNGFSSPKVKAVTAIFAVQLIINLVWSLVFFGFRSPLAGLTTIVILWLTILWTIFRFYEISTAAGLLLIPYLLWVSFASVLNLSIFLLNR